MNTVAENVEFASQAETEVEAPKKKEKPVISEAIINAFVAGKNAEKDENNILIDMVQAGAPFRRVPRFYKQLMVEYGFEVSEENKNIVLENAFRDADITTEEGFNAVVAYVDNEIEQTNERGAAQMVRGYARKHNIDFFKKPKAESAGLRVAFTNNFYKALIENPNMTEEDVHNYIVEHGSEATLKAEKSYQKVAKVANAIVEKYTH